MINLFSDDPRGDSSHPYGQTHSSLSCFYCLLLSVHVSLIDFTPAGVNSCCFFNSPFSEKEADTIDTSGGETLNMRMR